MRETFKVSEPNLRELAERTVGDPLPEAVRGEADGALADGDPAQFYLGFVSGLNCSIHLLAKLNDENVIKAVFTHLMIRGAKFYFAAAEHERQG